MKHFVTATEAARHLNVSQHAVRQMLDSGRLISSGTAGRSTIIEPKSLHRASRETNLGCRGWKPETAWTSMSLLSGDTEIPRSPEYYRARARIKNIDTPELQSRTRRRGVIRRYRGSLTAVSILRDTLVLTGRSTVDEPLFRNKFDLSPRLLEVEGYAPHDQSEALVTSLGLREDADGNIVIRSSDDIVLCDGKIPLAVAALDLMDSLDTREYDAGCRVLNELLSSHA